MLTRLRLRRGAGLITDLEVELADCDSRPAAWTIYFKNRGGPVRDR